MKIGFFTDTYLPVKNGVVTSITGFGSSLQKRGHEVFIFTPSYPGYKDKNKNVIRLGSIPAFIYPDTRLSFPYSFKARAAVKKIGLDVIHSHDPFSLGIFALAVSKEYKIPHVHTYHTLYPEYVHYILNGKLINSKAAQKISMLFCNQCNGVIAPSTKISKLLRKWGVKKPIDVVSSGINFDFFQTKEKDYLRKKIKVDKNRRILLTLSRLGKEKNIEFLIKSMRRFNPKEYLLVIAGTGPEKENLEKLTQKLKFSDRITFYNINGKEEIPKIYNGANVFVYASKSETQGLVVLEAMASGLPIAALSDGAIADMVEDGQNGFLIRGGQKEFVSAIKKILNNKNLCQEMSRESKSLAKNITSEKQADKLTAVYKKLLK